jgi:hypothetical protein
MAVAAPSWSVDWMPMGMSEAANSGANQLWRERTKVLGKPNGGGVGEPMARRSSEVETEVPKPLISCGKTGRIWRRSVGRLAMNSKTKPQSGSLVTSPEGAPRKSCWPRMATLLPSWALALVG